MRVGACVCLISLPPGRDRVLFAVVFFCVIVYVLFLFLSLFFGGLRITAMPHWQPNAVFGPFISISGGWTELCVFFVVVLCLSVGTCFVSIGRDRGASSVRFRFK